MNITLWQELIWNIDFARNLIFLVLAIVVAIFVIPKEVRRLQKKRENQLAKAFLSQWGNICISAITADKPDTETEQRARTELSASGDWDLSGYVSTEQTIHDLWEDIRSGKRDPDGSAMLINNALEQVLYTDEERTNKGLPAEKRYPFPSSRAVPRSWVRRILNPMYAKIEIFDVELLPIGELEMAISYLDSFSQQGYFTRHQFMSYALHLAQSMEKFAKHLWQLEGWATKVVIEEQKEDTKSKAGVFLSIAIALFAFTVISHGISQILVCLTAVFFAVSSIILRINAKTTVRFRKWLRHLNVDYLVIFLGLVSVVVVLLQSGQVIPASVVFIAAYIFLIINILRSLVTIKRNNKPKADN